MMIATIAVYVLRVPPATGADLQLTVTESAITARDGNNRELWTSEFGESHRHVLSQLNEHVRIASASSPSVFAASAIRLRRSDNHVENGRLTALDLRGRLRWQFEFDDVLRIGARTFDGPWGIEGFSIDDRAEGRRIAITAHHYTWSPSIVAVIDDTGRRLSRYVNNGWLEQVQWLSTGRLAVSGYSESRGGGMVALLDPARSESRSPEDDVAHLCENCGAEQPLRVVVMPRSEVNLATGSRFNRASLEYLGERLVVRTVEVPSSGQGPADAIYEFDTNLTLVRVGFSDRYWETHDQLYASKALDHDRAHCPDREGPSRYQAWSPDGGWSAVVAR